jgi:site-specific DNA-methyltransferase (cytosine-N4-specific)
MMYGMAMFSVFVSKLDLNTDRCIRSMKKSPKKPVASFPCQCCNHLITAIKCPKCGDLNLATVKELAAVARLGRKFNEDLVGRLGKTTDDLSHRAFGRNQPDHGIIAAAVSPAFKPTKNLIHGDALAETKKLAADSFDLCVTSPPYFGLVTYGVKNDYGAIQDLNTWLEKMVDLFREVRRVLKRDGVCCIEIGEKYDGKGSRHLVPHRLAIALADDGWLMRQEIIISKSNARPERNQMNRPMMSHHQVLVLSKRPSNFYNEIKENHRSVWEIYTRDGVKGSGSHPTPMQSQIAIRCITSFSPEGGHVFDPFVGSGQVAVAAVEHNRHITGIDANQKYLAIAQKRLFAA